MMPLNIVMTGSMARDNAAASRTSAVIVMPESRLIIAAARLPWAPALPAGSCM